MPHKHKHTDALNEIGYWLDWLKQKGTEKVTLMGHSRGGNQTAWYAAEHDSSIIDKVILIAPAFTQPSVGAEQQPVLDKANKMVAEGKGKAMLANTDFIYCKGAKVSAEAFADYYNAKPQFETVALLKNSHKPTLVVIGSADTVVEGLSEAVEPLESRGVISTVIIEDADHFFQDFANEDLAAAAAEFINQ